MNVQHAKSFYKRNNKEKEELLEDIKQDFLKSKVSGMVCIEEGTGRKWTWVYYDGLTKLMVKVRTRMLQNYHVKHL